MTDDSSTRAPEWVGATLHGRYRIDAPLGEGGLGQVFRATHLGLDRPVAVKVLHRELLSNEALRRRFEREVKTLSRLAHPHIVTLTDSGVLDDGVGYLVMELLEGQSLEQRLAEGPMAPEEAIAIGRQILLGLAEAHDKGVLHRDIKPANVFLQPLADAGTHVKLLDFGLAKVRGDVAEDPAAHPTLTADGTIVGTPTYMAPEQAAGATLDASSDVYAVGVVLFEMLAGAPPFVRDGKLEIIRAHLRDDPPALDAVRPALRPSEPLQALVDRALAKDRLRRFESARQMLAALDALPEPAATLGDEPAPARRQISGTEDTIALGSEELAPASRPGASASAAQTAAALPAAEAREADEARRGPTTVPERPSAKEVGALGETVPALPASKTPASKTPASRTPASRTPASRTQGRSDAPSPAGGRTIQSARPRGTRVLVWVAVLAAVTAAVVSWAFWSRPPDRPVPAPPEEVVDAPAEANADAGAVPVEEGADEPGNPFRAGTLPDELRPARRKILRGRWLGDDEARALRRYQRAHRDDPRPSLLLARHHRLQAHWAPMVRHYRRAHRIDPEVIGFSPMLSDLLDATQEAPSSRAAIALVVDAFGADALPAVEEELEGRREGPERRRLERLARRLRAREEP
ncbi:MAG TPA: serine/threonine-protein kinase [Sandaracinaceae bacterium LLY-WYZ-13_1]|nr:serine/threonine-protein kinase [Sandaracinaceae bacterium LLY-WYZ-13_1]